MPQLTYLPIKYGRDLQGAWLLPNFHFDKDKSRRVVSPEMAQLKVEVFEEMGDSKLHHSARIGIFRMEMS